MNKLRYFFPLLKFLGFLIVCCVWAGLIHESNVFERILFNGLLIYGLLGFATVTMILTILQDQFEFITTELLTMLGFLLLIAGASIPYFAPQYLHFVYGLPIYYWFKVSLYSIPAICTEGAAFTLFLAAYGKGLKDRSSHEPSLVSVFFILYAISTVAMNFLALNGNITVDAHILFSMVSTAVVFIIALAYALSEPKGL